MVDYSYELINLIYNRMKTTRATIKSFIKKEFKNGNLYAKALSDFNGMVDMVEDVKDDFSKVESIDINKNNTLGINALWLVGQSRDSFENYADNNYIGYKIYNCCGSSIIAMGR